MILIYPAGMDATAQILTHKLEELKGIMAADEIFALKEMLKQSHTPAALEMIEEIGVHAVCEQMDTGVFGALVALGNQEKVGIFVNPDRIFLLQPTKFLCKHYGLNPYRIPSAGCKLVVAKPSKGERLVNRLKEKGIPADKIGEITGDQEIYYMVNDTQLPIAKPAADEMQKVLVNK